MPLLISDIAQQIIDERLTLQHTPGGHSHDQKKHDPTKGRGVPKYKNVKLIRYTHKDGTGLLNNFGLDRMKLTDDEENELIEVMDFGLQQPPGRRGGEQVTGKFYFTEEGEKKHKRLIELLTKASKTGIVKSDVRYTGTPSWESTDGQVAIDPEDIIGNHTPGSPPQEHDQKKHGKKGARKLKATIALFDADGKAHVWAVPPGQTHASAYTKAKQERPDLFDEEGNDIYGGHYDLFKTEDGRYIDRFQASEEFDVASSEAVADILGLKNDNLVLHELVRNHTPGGHQHDQKKHGRRHKGTGRTEKEIKEAKSQQQKRLKAITTAISKSKRMSAKEAVEEFGPLIWENAKYHPERGRAKTNLMAGLQRESESLKSFVEVQDKLLSEIEQESRSNEPIDTSSIEPPDEEYLKFLLRNHTPGGKSHEQKKHGRRKGGAGKGAMPDKPSLYFKGLSGTKMIPVSKLKTTRARPKGIKNAEKHMKRAAAGTGGRRKPIEVRLNPDGTYSVVDGNSTTAVAKKFGFAELPAIVVNHSNRIIDIAADVVTNRINGIAWDVLNHKGPGSHPSGSSQKVHGKKGKKSTGYSLTDTDESTKNFLDTQIQAMKMFGTPPKDLKYLGFADLVLQEGQFFRPPKDEEQNTKLMEEYGVLEGKKKECFMNAGRCLIGGGRTDELTYVEGFALASFMPVHHAWLVTPDGQVIDPTWRGQDLSGVGIDKDLDPGTSYYGIPLSSEFVKESIMETEVWGVFDQNKPSIEVYKNGLPKDAKKEITVNIVWHHKGEPGPKDPHPSGTPQSAHGRKGLTGAPGSTWQHMLNPPPLSVVDTDGDGRVQVDEAAHFFQARSPLNIDTSKGKISDEHVEVIADSLADDILFLYSEEDNGAGFYDADITKMWEHLSKKHPELADDKDSQFLYASLLAITSNGQEVESNVPFADSIYSGWAKDGKLSSNFEFGGTANEPMRDHVDKLQEIINRKGLTRTREIFSEKMTVGEIEKLGLTIFPEDVVLRVSEKTGKPLKTMPSKRFDVDSELLSEEVPVFSTFGPKIGAFQANLQGDYEPVTMDRWFSRSFNRNTGELIGVKDDLARKQAKGLLDNVVDKIPIEEFDGLEKESIRQSLKDIASGELRLDEDTMAFKWVDFRRASYAEEGPGASKRKPFSDKRISHVKTAGLWKNVAEIRQTPGAGGRRRAIRNVMNRVTEKVSNKLGSEVTNAEMQATLWRYEQKLYQAVGARSKRLSLDSKSFSVVAEDMVDEWLKLQSNQSSLLNQTLYQLMQGNQFTTNDSLTLEMRSSTGKLISWTITSKVENHKGEPGPQDPHPSGSPQTVHKPTSRGVSQFSIDDMLDREVTKQQKEDSPFRKRMKDIVRKKFNFDEEDSFGIKPFSERHPEESKRMKLVLEQAMNAIPTGSLSQISGRLDEVELYAGLDGVKSSLPFNTQIKLEGKVVQGYFHRGDNRLVLDGSSSENLAYQIYLHELAHVVDDDQQWSGLDAWRDVWNKEILPEGFHEILPEHLGGPSDVDWPLTKYATMSPGEGYAEFSRLIYDKPEEAEERFPGAFDFFDEMGLLNDGPIE